MYIHIMYTCPRVKISMAYLTTSLLYHMHTIVMCVSLLSRFTVLPHGHELLTHDMNSKHDMNL